jgi:uncharacterized protein with NRDE domain
MKGLNQMCIILFSYLQHPRYRLIVAANRDEFYKRPTVPVHFWMDQPELLAGRDLEKMGTWMGITRTGRFAAITNYRDPNHHVDQARSRGELVSEYLKSQTSPAEYLNKVNRQSEHYEGFNLLVGDSNELLYFSNRDKHIRSISPGIHGISNHLLNTKWPKLEQGKRALENTLSTENVNDASLFELLSDSSIAGDEELPNTGVGLEKERFLSPIFIQGDEYGTRSSTIILIGYDNHVKLMERTFERSKGLSIEASFQFKIAASR